MSYVNLRKTLGIACEALTQKGIRIPKGAITCDAVKLKKDGILTKIYTFRDENQKMIYRYIRKRNGKEVTDTYKKYDELSPIFVDLVPDGSEIAWLNSRRVRSHTRINGKLSEIKEEVVTISDEEIPHMTKTSRVIKPEADCEPLYHAWNIPKSETISIEQRQKGTKPIFIKNEYNVDKFSSGDYYLAKSEVSSDSLKEIAENPYFLPYTSQESKFIRRMAYSCIEDAGLINTPKVSLYKKAGKTLGLSSHFGDEVSINLMSKEGFLEPRTSLVNVIGHEVGHSKWAQKSNLLEMDELIGTPVEEIVGYTVHEIPKIKKYKYAIKHYTPSEVNYKKYHDNYAEVVGREEGAKVSRKYSDFDKKIEDVFSFLHPNQFYVPNFEKLRDESLFEYLSHFKA